MKNGKFEPAGLPRSDLACECGAREEAARDASFSEATRDGFEVEVLEIKSSAAEKRLGKPKGKYITVKVGRIWEELPARRLAAARLIGGYLRSIAGDACRGGDIGEGDVLVCGLGNRMLTADALGPLCADRVMITRHIREDGDGIFELLSHASVAAVAPGVASQTGIEAAQILRGVCDSVKPSLAVAVDALAARDTSHLVTTVQLCNTGIAPGSGVGGRRLAVDKGTLGVPVISIGAPTIVDSFALVRDALEKAGVGELCGQMASRESFFVSVGDADVAVAGLADLIAAAIDNAFGRDTRGRHRSR